MEHAEFLGRIPVGPTPSPAAPMLEIMGIQRRFAATPAVEDVSFSVQPGQVTCLLGPSGCGKSTTLRMIAGIEKLDAGEIRIAGEVVADGRRDLPPEQRPVGMVFQDLALFPHMTIAENVGFGLPRGRRAAAVEHLLERVGLAHHKDKYPHQLSGGEQQRIALIRALATEPQVMLLDEPFSSLDQRLRVEMRELALDLLREAGTAVVLVTHDPEEAMMMADRIAIMHAGRVRQEGAPLDLYLHPVDLAVASFFSDLNLFPGRVEGGLVRTALGDLVAPDLAEGTGVDCALRPEHLRPCRAELVGVRAKVQRVQNLGREHCLELQLPELDHPLRCTAPGYCAFQPGDWVGMAFDPASAMVFPR